MRNNYHLQKNISFVIIVLLGINYFVLLLVSAIKILPGFLMQLIFLIDSIRTQVSLGDLFTQHTFYLHIISGIGVITLILLAIRSVIRSILNIYRTYRFIRNLSVIDTQNDYVYIENDFSHAFTAGILRPKIYISDQLIETLSEQELHAVKEHEQFHRKTLDPLMKILADFVKSILPYFPFKKHLFDSYEVLVELSADTYAESKLNTKKHVVTALSKMINISNYDKHLSLSSFSLNNERIPILVESKVFKTRAYFIFFIFSLFVIMINTYLISNTNIFLECQHIAECINALISQASDTTFGHTQVCTISDKFSDSYHCINYTDRHIL
jgi:hypothetical protein